MNIVNPQEVLKQGLMRNLKGFTTKHKPRNFIYTHKISDKARVTSYELRVENLKARVKS